MTYPTKGYFEYMEAMFDPFWLELYGKDPNQIADALFDNHYDKTYQYWDYWVDRGIHPYRGSLIYMLTFTERMGDTPKSKSKEWVVDNFKTYEETIKKLEQTYMLFKRRE
jgi:hypothetical protein